MASPFIAEIRIFAGNFAPQGWSFCDGSLLSIANNTALFSLIGTTYGGDGQTTFALPDLRNRVPVHMGTGTDGTAFVIGQSGGTATVTLTAAQLPSHTHGVQALSGPATAGSPALGVYANALPKTPYASAPSRSVTMNAAMLAPTGGGQPHDNMQPYLGISFIISLFGIFPSQT